MQNDLKVQAFLKEDGHTANDPFTKEGSSILGKYITGAKNNFRGFNSRNDDQNTSSQVAVHHEEEEVDNQRASDMLQNQVGESGAEGSQQVTDSDVVKMEEGRLKAELVEEKETGEKDKNKNTDNKMKEDVSEGSFNNVEEVKAEVTQDEAEKRGAEVKTGVKVTETIHEHAESSFKNTDVKKIADKFKNIELQEKKVKAKWTKARRNNRAEESGVRDSNENGGIKKMIPSPTGSSSSQDTGFGSQEGEGSIIGTLVRP